MVTAWGHTVLFHLVSFHFSQAAAVSQKMTIKFAAQFLLDCSRAVRRSCACVHYSGRNADRLERRRGEEEEKGGPQPKTRGRRKFMSLLWDYTWQLSALLLYIMLLLYLLCLVVFSTGGLGRFRSYLQLSIVGCNVPMAATLTPILRSTSKIIQ